MKRCAGTVLRGTFATPAGNVLSASSIRAYTTGAKPGCGRNETSLDDASYVVVVSRSSDGRSGSMSNAPDPTRVGTVTSSIRVVLGVVLRTIARCSPLERGIALLATAGFSEVSGRNSWRSGFRRTKPEEAPFRASPRSLENWDIPRNFEADFPATRATEAFARTKIGVASGCAWITLEERNARGDKL
ncbi:hypothetical protein KM043_012200 [Ampulex compressa]|nr:hypothetical protein KM043_012200 [Ampulex compressa]